MKKITLLVLFLIPLCSYSQTNDSVFIEQYCEVVVYPKSASNKVTIAVDFGDDQKYFTDILNEEGKKAVFISPIAAMNFMAEDGWRLHSTLLIYPGDRYKYYYIMKKKIKIPK